jgi:hypothetical protein
VFEGDIFYVFSFQVLIFVLARVLAVVLWFCPACLVLFVLGVVPGVVGLCGD